MHESNLLKEYYGVHFDKLSELVNVLVAEPVEVLPKGRFLSSNLRECLQRSYEGVDVIR